MKVLNIMTGGLRREGITSTQLEFIKHMNLEVINMDVAAVTRNEQSVIDEFKANGCRVFEFPDRKKHLVKYLFALAKLIRKEKYDAIHVHGSSSMMCFELMLAKFLGVKARIAHSRNTLTNNQTAHKILYPCFSHSYTHALACGEDAGKWLFKDKPFTVLHNGKDLQKFKFNSDYREQIRNQYNLQDELVLGFVGNLNTQKNILFVIDVFSAVVKKNENVRLFLIGEGHLRNDIESKIKKLNIEDKVVLTGRISNVNEYLQAIDIMLLPSLYEGLPNVVLEWQAAGLMSFISNTVTNECVLCELVEQLPINEGVDIWVNKILSYEPKNRERSSELGCISLAKNNFEIVEAAKFMENYYIKSIEK